MVLFLEKILKFLHQNNIAYMLSGSVAMSIYIVPRATRDFDFVIHLQKKDIAALTDWFKDGYYCDKDSIEEAVQQKSMFNIIDHASGFKADFIILKDQTYRLEEFSRRRKNDFLGFPIYIVSPEDLLLSKLIWIQSIQSNIQMDDIKNLKEMEGLDWKYLNDWILNLNLNTFNLLN